MKTTDSKHRIKELLNLTQDSQNEMARKSGLTKSAISNYINGTREPRQDAIFYLSKAYNVNPAWLMGYDVPMESISDLEQKMAKARLDSFTIDENDEESLKKNEEKFWLYHQDYEKVKRAIDFMNHFDNADPDVQSAIQTLLKYHQQDS